jgi:hypothetical protein
LDIPGAAPASRGVADPGSAPGACWKHHQGKNKEKNNAIVQFGFSFDGHNCLVKKVL